MLNQQDLETTEETIRNMRDWYKRNEPQATQAINALQKVLDTCTFEEDDFNT